MGVFGVLEAKELQLLDSIQLIVFTPGVVFDYMLRGNET